ncbi:VCBS repeat-containing protein [Lysobacter sp. SG-8]|uniref:VCBS repeat-containing protein n=2 Tax=Marilutibacter penaei TaxID=2759900 RepID=A0A7W3U531_9GAMM|nr:VCBS repeat-containing protein [Lysobacter penaei]
MRKLGWVVLCWIGMTGMAMATDFSFGVATRLTLARETASSVAIGDANGDGRADLAVINDIFPEKHRLELYLQRADGSLARPVGLDLPEAVAWGYPVAFVDLDDDGAREILVGTTDLTIVKYASDTLTVMESRWVRYGCAYLADGDVDADGHVDVLCHSGIGTPSSATVLYGNGRGGFRSTLQLLTGVGTFGSQPDLGSVRLADVNNDGHLDLLVTASRVGNFFVYPGDGAGGFGHGTGYPHPPSSRGIWAAGLEVLDLDGDGINEVVTASPDNQPDAMLNIYRLQANGYLALSERRPTYDSTTALLTADVDGDGDTELLAGHFYFHAVTVLGAGGPGLTQPVRYELPGFGNQVEYARLLGTSKALALGDLDGDDCIDLAAATYSGVLLLQGCRPHIRRIPSSDFDGDGVSDLLWRSFTSEVMMWQWADVEAWRQCALPCPVHKVGAWQVQVFGDFNGDGTSDVFWRDADTGQNAVLLSGFYERPLRTVTNQDWQVVGSGDFNGDDESDLLWRNGRTGANVIWMSGDYRRQQATRGVTDLRWHVAGVGDFDGDGRSDILWRHASSGKNVVWPSGRFETRRAVTAVTDTRWQIQGVGDFNGDGQDDIVWRQTETGGNVIWLSGNYRTRKNVVTVTNRSWSIEAVGDYNGDGVSDLFWRNSRTGANVIWRSADYKTQQSVAPMEAGGALRLLP